MRSLPFSISRGLVGLVLVGGLLGIIPRGRADIELPSVPTAQPEPVTAKIFLGESVEIPLRGVSRSGQQLQFLIRRKPQAGTLSAVTPTSRSTAVVTYTHDPAAGAAVDRFRYAVRAPNGGVSTPAEVIVNVVERPAVFVAPKRVDFPDVALGESAGESFAVRNDGGGRLEGRLTVPAPWKLSGSTGDYSLGPGEEASFTIVFTPSEGRRFMDQGEFSHAAGTEIGLSGQGYAPIEVVPREVRLEADGRNEVRTGEFLLRNVSNADRELRLTAPAEAIVQDTVKLPAKSETHVAIHTRAGFLGALSGNLLITGGAVRLEVPLRVMAAPARLIVSPETVDFGALEAGQSGRAKLTLKNLGGSPAELRVKLPAGVLLDPDPSYEALAPGAEREFDVTFARPSAATLEDAITFEAGGMTLPLPVRGTVREDRAAAEAAPAGAPGTTEALKTNSLPPVAEIGFAQTKTKLELSWKRSSPDLVRYALVMREIGFDAKGQAVFKYKPLPRVKPRVVRDEVRATLEGLRPGEHLTLLVIGYDAAGKPTRPSPAFVVFTQPSVPLRIPWFWIGMLALAGFAGLFARERWKNRSSRGGN